MIRVILTKHLECIDDHVYMRFKLSGYPCGCLGQLFNMPKLPIKLMIEWDQIAELVFAEAMAAKKKARKRK